MRGFERVVKTMMWLIMLIKFMAIIAMVAGAVMMAKGCMDGTVAKAAGEFVHDFKAASETTKKECMEVQK